MKKIIFSLLLVILAGSVFFGVTGNAKEKDKADKVDVDLTTLSSTMVYSEVYNIVTNPNDYFGKKVRMKGVFVAYTNEDGSKFYPAVIIADATACCSQGLEFVLKGDPAYPDGYPEVNTEITVTGTFESYDEDNVIYYHLADAVIE